MMDVSIIIVNYNTKDLTRNCLKSVFEQTKDLDFEVFVSDNGSIDGSVEMIKTEFPQVHLIENNANLGFGAANNRATKLAKGKYVFFLNSDTVLLNNAVKIFFDYWENAENKDEIGAIGSNLLNKNGDVIHSGGMFPTEKSELNNQRNMIFRFLIKRFLNKMNINYTNLKQSPVQKFYTGTIDYITGADLFMLNNQNAYFDERFFMYYEETDLQFQLFKKRKERFLIAGPKIIHFCGGSDREKNEFESYTKKTALINDISRIKYLEKNISIRAAIKSRNLTKIFYRIPYNWKKDSVKIYWQKLNEYKF